MHVLVLNYIILNSSYQLLKMAVKSAKCFVNLTMQLAIDQASKTYCMYIIIIGKVISRVTIYYKMLPSKCVCVWVLTRHLKHGLPEGVTVH